MSIYVVRACRSKKGKSQEVQQLLKQATESIPGVFVYQSMADPNDFGVFAEFASEEAARKFAKSVAQVEVTDKISALVDCATSISLWKQA